jgi:hypothetical protein
MRVNFGVHLSACRQPGLSDTPDDPGTVTIYHFGCKYTILKQKKPTCGGGLKLFKGDKTVSQYHLSRVS